MVFKMSEHSLGGIGAFHAWWYFLVGDFLEVEKIDEGLGTFIVQFC